MKVFPPQGTYVLYKKLLIDFRYTLVQHPSIQIKVNDKWDWSTDNEISIAMYNNLIRAIKGKRNNRENKFRPNTIYPRRIN